MTKARVVRSVGQLRPKVSVDDQLDWFFNEAEGNMAASSNFFGAVDSDGERSFLGYVEAARRHRKIRERLLSIPDSDAGVLQCAHTRRPWPDVLVQRFGRLTGVIVRLACALDRWPSDRLSQQVIEMARAEWLVPECVAGVGKTLARLVTESEARLSRASDAYDATRESP